MKARIYDNGAYRDMTDEEIAELCNAEQPYKTESKDNLTALAEGLSTATSLAQVRSSAKAVLKAESEAKNE